MKSSSAILSFTFITAVAANLIEFCNHDNVLRCLLGNAPIATPYCKSYISISIPTITISTFTPCVTVTKGAKPAVAHLPTFIDIKARRQLAINSAKAKLTPPTVTPAPAAQLDLLRRGFLPVPGCLTQVSSTSYPASRISSACSCLAIPTFPIKVIATVKPTTVTITPKSKRMQQSVIGATEPTKAAVNGIPTGKFQISGTGSFGGSLLEGVLEDDFYTGFGLPYGEYTLEFTIDPSTGYVSVEAPGKDGSAYLVAYTGLLAPGNTIPYVVTESSPVGSNWTPFTCRVGKDANGKFPLMCRAGEYTIPTLVTANGDGHKELGIGKPGDRSGSGEVGLYANFI